MHNELITGSISSLVYLLHVFTVAAVEETPGEVQNSVPGEWQTYNLECS